MFGADKTGVDLRNPVHQPVCAEINAVSPDSEQRKVHRQHPAEALVLPRLGFQHIEI